MDNNKRDTPCILIPQWTIGLYSSIHKQGCGTESTHYLSLVEQGWGYKGVFNCVTPAVRANAVVYMCCITNHIFADRTSPELEPIRLPIR